MKWTPIKVGARIWPLSASPPEQWGQAFQDGVGETITGPIDGPGLRLTDIGVVWADAPKDEASANGIVKAWVDAANRTFESLVVTPSNQFD